MPKYKVKRACKRYGKTTKSYAIGDTIEATPEKARAMAKAGYIHPIPIKEKAKKKETKK